MFDWFNKKRKANEKALTDLRESHNTLINAYNKLSIVVATQSDLVDQQYRCLEYYRHKNGLLLELTWILYDISQSYSKLMFKNSDKYTTPQLAKIHRNFASMWKEYEVLNKALVKGMKSGKYEKIEKITVVK